MITTTNYVNTPIAERKTSIQENSCQASALVHVFTKDNKAVGFRVVTRHTKTDDITDKKYEVSMKVEPMSCEKYDYRNDGVDGKVSAFLSEEALEELIEALVSMRDAEVVFISKSDIIAERVCEVK